MLNREENYNQYFKNGGRGATVLNISNATNVDRTVSNWTLQGKKGVKGS